MKASRSHRRRALITILVVAFALIALAACRETSIHDVLEDLQAILTSLVIIIGGFWFLERRLHFPRAEIGHAASFLRREEGVLLILQVQIANKGDLKINLNHGEYEIQTVPGSPEPLRKGLLFEDGTREVEGGESEEFWYEITLPASIEHIRVYTCVRNEFRRDGACWDKSTYFWVHDGKSLG